MEQVIRFTPRQERSAHQNLRDLITLARDHLTLWADRADFAWNSDRWPTTHITIRFTNWENRELHHAKIPEPSQLMHPAFAKFAKALLRYRHTLKPRKTIGKEMAALRALEFVLRKDLGIPDITQINQRHFDQLMTLIKPTKSRQHIASCILNLLGMLADFFIVRNGVHYWKNPFTGTNSYAFRNGEHASFEIKANKVADQDSLLAIADVFGRGHSQTLEDGDVMITSITAVLLCAPLRINELLRFRTDCLASDIDKDGKTQQYLQLFVPKTKDFVRKPITATMAETAVEAVSRLKTITEEGRRLALYMEGNPTRFYRHANCPDVPDDQELTREQVAQAIGLTCHSAESFIKRHTGSYRLTGFTLNSLWQLILAEHRKVNPRFPYQQAVHSSTRPPLKMSESLLCALRYQFSSECDTSPVLLAPFEGRSHYAMRLRGHKSMCFFTRHGFASVKLKSHGIRHLVNQLARQSGISIERITEWSSRASKRQTLTYLNEDPTEIVARAADKLGLSVEQTPKLPITNEQAELYGQGPFHRSRYGLCRRSWRIGPCNKFADCLNCSELLMCKGDKVAVETIKADRENLVRTFEAAHMAIESGERSASRWTEMAAPQIERLDRLITVLNDPAVPDGSPIEIVGTDFNHERTLVHEKAESAGVKLLDRTDLGLEYGSELLACLDLLRSPENAKSNNAEGNERDRCDDS